MKKKPQLNYRKLYLAEVNKNKKLLGTAERVNRLYIDDTTLCKR